RFPALIATGTSDVAHCNSSRTPSSSATASSAPPFMSKRSWLNRTGDKDREQPDMQLATLDLIIIVIYAIGLFTLAQWLSRDRGGQEKDSTAYFLASKALPWWAIGASLIAANISAEQIVGMSGSGYAIGLAIASYEWMAALTLLIVGKWFLPIFLANK